MELIYRYLESPLGILKIACTDKALVFCNIAERAEEENGKNSISDMAVNQLKEYFAKKRKEFDVPLELTGGTELQRSVWKALLNIPYGKTVTYSEVAEMAGNKRAVRACATAVGKNHLIIFVPCHRVVAKNGIGGFSAGGIENKKILLSIERGEKNERA